jgi:dTDP-4-amino-4,6-dideoxy-D-galactose acyltransferase
MEIMPLHWDSQFFEIKIGRIEPQESSDLECLREHDYDLVYIFVSTDRVVSLGISLSPALLVDEKVVFCKKVTSRQKNINCRLFDALLDDYQQLLFLAIESGHQSRFKLDEKFAPGKFELMYDTWLRKSLSGELAQYVFVYKNTQSEKILGFVTVQVKSPDIAVIGLLAVDPTTRGMGIGRSLLDNIEHQLTQIGVSQIEVPTQLANKIACGFYQGTGFSIQSITNIYHCWNKKYDTI